MHGEPVESGSIFVYDL
jgi:MerR family mercuric resistance operon transcriptional regulator